MTAKKRIVSIAGGTHSYLRPHLTLSAPAYGTTGLDLANQVSKNFDLEYESVTEFMFDQYFTKMAGGPNCSYGPYRDHVLDTNDDVSGLLDKLIADPETNILFMPVALCDFNVESMTAVDVNNESTKLPVGKQYPRLKTIEFIGKELNVKLTPADKLIHKVRQTRKDIFLVGFKTTTGLYLQDQFEAGLRLLKEASCNLVLVNDLTTRLNMIVTPEQAKYAVTTDRLEAITELVKMTAARSNGKFTRSTVMDGDIVPWNSPEVPDNLRRVVNYAISRGAYRPFNGKTVGHFAAKVGDSRFLTSIRKTNFNDLLSDPDNNGLVKVETVGDDKVMAYGAKPSVGGQSQRIIFANHPDTNAIFHAHIQLKSGSKIPIRPQWQAECGSHACGSNTSDGLQKFDHGIWAVYLEKHGPNIAFGRDTTAEQVIEFIDQNFEIDRQTSELT
jgi:hypothetical protein